MHNTNTLCQVYGISVCVCVCIQYKTKNRNIYRHCRGDRNAVGPSCTAASAARPTVSCRKTLASSQRALDTGTAATRGAAAAGHQMEWQEVTQTAGSWEHWSGVVKHPHGVYWACPTNCRQTTSSSSHCNSTATKVKKVKVAHTRVPSVWFKS